MSFIIQPATASGGTITAVASGSLTTGQTVVLNTDGSVTAVTGSNGVIGTPVIYNSAASSAYMGSVYDPVSGKIIIAFVNGQLGGSYAIVGTVSGSTISFGSPVLFSLTSGTQYSLAYDSVNSKVVIAYTNFNGAIYEAKAIIGTISGTSISFGTASSIQAVDNSRSVSITYVGSGKIVAFVATGASYATGFFVGSISGTSISFGVVVISNTSGLTNCGPKAIAYDTVNSKFVCTYSNNSPAVFTIVGSVSGTTVTLGTPSTVSSISIGSQTTSSTYDISSGKTVITYGNNSTSYVNVGTISGTTLTLGSAYTLPSGNAQYITPSYDSTNSRIIFTYDSGLNLVYSVGYVSGSTISISSSATILTTTLASNSFCVSCFDSINMKIIASYIDSATVGDSLVFQSESSNLRTKPFIGFSNSNYSNGNTATINIIGSIDNNQSGMSIGVAQYVQANGTLGISPAQSQNAYAGYSLSSTKILIKG